MERSALNGRTACAAGAAASHPDRQAAPAEMNNQLKHHNTDVSPTLVIDEHNGLLLWLSHGQGAHSNPVALAALKAPPQH